MMLVRALLIGSITLLAVGGAFGAIPAQGQIQPSRHRDASQAPLMTDVGRFARIAEVNDDRRIEAPRATLKAGDDTQATSRA